MPTGPVPASTAARRPRTSPPAARTSFTTAAAAVVFEPLGSSMTETRKGPKKALRAATSRRSASGMLEPPMKRAVFFRSFGPRVKMAPWTRPWTSASATAAVAQHLVGSRIVGHDAVERAGQTITVQLDEQFAHRIARYVHRLAGPCRRGGGSAYLSAPPAKGCVAVFAPLSTSSTVGFPLSARSMDSLVAW